MIRNKARKRYYNSKVYVYGVGKLGRITRYSVVEDADGIYQKWVVATADRVAVPYIYTSRSNFCIYDSMKFATIDNTIIAVVKVDGRTYIGTATTNPNDETYSINLGRALALARAFKDSDAETEILDYVKEKNAIETELDAE